jgi:peptidyl-dipeptidase Dcp
VKRPDIQAYHPDVDVYEVREATGAGAGAGAMAVSDGGADDDRLVAVFIHDNFARQYKSSGAWMSEYRGQTKNLPAG